MGEDRMKQETLVTVIVPIYNVAPYLREALDSLINQTYRNLEILLIDDGSDDGSELICDEYQRKDQRISVYHQDNKGLSAARNSGLNHMTGDVVAFLDPDDVMFPNMIETALRTMKEKAVRLVAFGAVWFHNGEFANSPEGGYYDRKDALINFNTKRGIAGAIWTKMVASSLFPNIRFREGHNYADAEVFFRILDKCKTLYVIHEPLFRYRKRENSITATNTLANLLDAVEQVVWLTEYAKSVNTDGFLNKEVERLEISSIKAMLIIFSALSYDSSRESETVKHFYKVEIEKREKRISYSQVSVKLATKLFLISPKLFVFLYERYKTIKAIF